MRSPDVHVATKCKPLASNWSISSGFTSKRWRWRSEISGRHTLLPHAPFLFPYSFLITLFSAASVSRTRARPDAWFHPSAPRRARASTPPPDAASSPRTPASWRPPAPARLCDHPPPPHPPGIADHRHLQTQTDAQIRLLLHARERRRLDHALHAATAEAAGDEDAVCLVETVPGGAVLLGVRLLRGVLEVRRLHPVDDRVLVDGVGRVLHRLRRSHFTVLPSTR